MAFGAAGTSSMKGRSASVGDIVKEHGVHGGKTESLSTKAGLPVASVAEMDLISRLPSKYAVVTTREDRATHVQLLEELTAGESGPLLIEWHPPGPGDKDAKLYLVFRDRSGLLKRIFHILSDEFDINISEAFCFCTTDGWAIDLLYCSSETRDVKDRASFEQILPQLKQQLVDQLTLHPGSSTSDITAEETAAPAAPASEAAQAAGSCEAAPAAASSESADDSALTWPWPQSQIDVWNEKQFADLSLIKFVAEGSDSKVWEARWGAATVAVKVLKDEPCIGKHALRSFMSEVEIWRNLRHPHICPFMGTCMQDGRPAIVLEFMRGGSLYALLHGRKSKPLETSTKCSIALEVASGIAYLHSKGILHRDIKTANILLDEQQHAKVADFGISRHFGNELTAETGTYRTMAPEVITHKQYGFKCDVYSFGMLLWEVMHQQIPFREYSPLQAAFTVAMENKRPPMALAKELQPYEELITKCWQHDPDLRPDCDQVVATCSQLSKTVGSPRSGRPSVSSGTGKSRSLNWFGTPRRGN